MLNGFPLLQEALTNGRRAGGVVRKVLVKVDQKHARDQHIDCVEDELFATVRWQPEAEQIHQNQNAGRCRNGAPVDATVALQLHHEMGTTVYRRFVHIDGCVRFQRHVHHGPHGSLGYLVLQKAK